MADSALHKPDGSMLEIESKEESTLPSKRKLDSLPISEAIVVEDHSHKSQKFQSLTHNGNSPVHEEKSTENRFLESSTKYSDEHKNGSANNSDEKIISEAQTKDKDLAIEEVEEEDDADYDDDDDDDEENGEAAVVDRKGKGIMIEEEEDDSDDDDDSTDGGSELEADDSELDDDPLAEVDLDNILPSRTRGRAGKAGVYIPDDPANDDDDSDDSDA